MAQYGLWVRDDWPMFGYDPAHTGWNKAENVISPANVGRLALEWRGFLGLFSNSSPAVVRDVVYAGSEDGKLYAFHVDCARQGGTCTHCGPARLAA